MSAKSSKNKVDLIKVAEEATHKVSTVLSQNANVNIAEADDVGVGNLPLLRAMSIDNLPKAITIQPIEDVTTIPAETMLTISLIADDSEQEVKEITTVEGNLSLNVESMHNFNKNFEQRNEHLSEIVEGTLRAVNAIEDEDLDEDLRELEETKRNLRKALDIILNTAFPDMKRELKTMIEGCVAKAGEENPYVKVPEDVDLNAVNLLLMADIIEESNEDPSYVKLAFDVE